MIQSIGTNQKIQYKKGGFEKNKALKPGSHNVSFGSALTVAQRADLSGLTRKMYDILGMKENFMVIHSPSFAPQFCDEIKRFIDTGVGTSCGVAFKKFVKFCSDLFGTTGIQFGPETSITRKIHSPYSYGAFNLSEHIIDPITLFRKGLISKETLESLPEVAEKTGEKALKADYDGFFGRMPKLLDEAYLKFKSLDTEDVLRKEFQDFKNLPEVKPWLEKNALFQVIADEHKSSVIFDWPDLDKKLNLYREDSALGKTNEAAERVAELKSKYEQKLEQFEFYQFLAHKQKIGAKLEAQEIGQHLSGDIKVGNGNEDLWAFPKAFIADLDKNTCSTLGCDPDNDWGFYALNPVAQEAKKFLGLKIDQTLLYHDALRFDAIFGYVEPYLTDRQYIPHKSFTSVTPKKVFQGDSLIAVIKDRVDKHNIDLSLVGGENLGFEYDIARTKTILSKYQIPELHNFNPIVAEVESGRYDAGYGSLGYGYNGGYGHVGKGYGHNGGGYGYGGSSYGKGYGYNGGYGYGGSSYGKGYGYGGGGYGSYGGDGWQPFSPKVKKVIKERIPGEVLNSYKKKWFASTSHDTATLRQISGGDRDIERQILAYDFMGPEGFTGAEGWRRLFLFTDPFGIEARYNTPGNNDISWFTRLPENYEEFFYKNLALENKGYNLPEILLDAAKEKGIVKGHESYDEKLFSSLEKYKTILYDKTGPFTTEEAEKLAKDEYNLTARKLAARKAFREKRLNSSDSSDKFLNKKNITIGALVLSSISAVVGFLFANKKSNILASSSLQSKVQQTPYQYYAFNKDVVLNNKPVFTRFEQ